MAWEVVATEQVQNWADSLTGKSAAAYQAAKNELELRGPGLRRPFVGNITSSRHSNMKELIPRGGAMRILFAFDPNRRAVLLIAGDKTNQWTKWYRVNIPIADSIYDEYLEEL